MKNLERGVAAVTADQIIADLCGRRGLGQEWYQIREDIQSEIREKWIGIIEEALTAATEAI